MFSHHAPKPSRSGSKAASTDQRQVRERQKLRNCFGCSELFPVSEGHKLIQSFLQSLEPPFMVGGCRSISPVHMRAVRFTDLGYFFPKFLDTL